MVVPIVNSSSSKKRTTLLFCNCCCCCWKKKRLVRSFLLQRHPNNRILLLFACALMVCLLYLWNFFFSLDVVGIDYYYYYSTSSSDLQNIPPNDKNSISNNETHTIIATSQSTGLNNRATTTTTTTSTSTAVNNEIIINNKISSSSNNNNNNNRTEEKTTTPTKVFQYEVCFVTSVYSSSVSNGDRPPDVTEIKQQNPSFGFFAFTNLHDLVAPGWDIVVYQLSHKYRRYITQSRWPKFMVWQHPLMIIGGDNNNGKNGNGNNTTTSTCQAIFYMDGFCGPKIKHSERYKRIAKNISQSHFGLFQNKHEIQNGPLYELDRILEKKKDIAKNVEASKVWLQRQSDFSNNCTMYANHYIAYNPRSQYFQTAAKFFWDHYSLEQDSWRDQPLWCYVLDKFNITPTRLGTYEALFRDYFSRMGHAGHRYTDKADNNNKDENNTNSNNNNNNNNNARRKLPQVLSNSKLKVEKAMETTTTNYSNSIMISSDTLRTSAADPKEICFVTASYSSSVDNADRPPGVRKLLETNPNFGRFIAFTNLPNLDAPGWTILTTNNLTSQYNRYITQSRWPKFMGWKNPYIQKNCQVVFYLDAYCRPKEKFAHKFKLLAKQIMQSTSGLAQNLHEWGMGPIAEFDRILEKEKDTLENVNASITWLQSQPDFNASCTLYSNQYIAYDPQNKNFQKMANDFWSIYSQEFGSYRDQPYWAYTIDKFKVQPISDFGSFKTMYKEHKSRMAPGNHKYVH